jgi:sec-independent protein translocase protein TatA
MFRNPLIDALVVLLAVILIFGPKRLPLLGRSLGQGMREFKDSIAGHSSAEADEVPALTEASVAGPTTALSSTDGVVETAVHS